MAFHCYDNENKHLLLVLINKMIAGESMEIKVTRTKPESVARMSATVNYFSRTPVSADINTESNGEIDLGIPMRTSTPLHGCQAMSIATGREIDNR